MPYAEAVAAREKLALHETTFDGEWVRNNVARVIETIEEPPLGLPVLAQYRLFELVRQHGVTVVLDGQGSDEILAGYPYHQRIVITQSLRRGRAVAALRELHSIASRAQSNVARFAYDWYAAPILRRTKRPRWIDPDYGRASVAHIESSRDPSPLNRRLHYDVRYGNVKIILGYADRNAMAHSIEARVPFLDHELVEFATRVPPAYKLKDTVGKSMLKKAAEPYLDHDMIYRQKQGFGAPMEEWFSEGDFGKRCMAAFDRSALSKEGYFDNDYFRGLLKQQMDGGGGHSFQLWTVLNAVLWHESWIAGNEDCF